MVVDGEPGTRMRIVGQNVLVPFVHSLLVAVARGHVSYEIGGGLNVA